MRKALRKVAELNGVEDKIHIFGIADDTLTAQLREAGLSIANAAVLCDIEGAEFDLLTAKLLEDLEHCRIIIELHEEHYEDGEERLARLIERAERHFTVSFLDQGPRELPSHGHVRHLIETDRWLLTSEGRCINQRWLVLRPRTN